MRSVFILFISMLCLSAHAQPQLQQNISAMGYSIVIKSIVADDAGHFILVGNIHSREESDRLRDPYIDSLIKLAAPKYWRQEHGIIILANDKLRPLDINILPHQHFTTVRYDKETKSFLLCGTRFPAPNEDYNVKIAIQRITVKEHKISKEISAFLKLPVSKEASVTDMSTNGKEIWVQVTADTMVAHNRLRIPLVLSVKETPDSFRVTTITKAPLSPTECVLTTPLYNSNGMLCFAASSCQFSKEIGINILRFRNNAITCIPFKKVAEHPFMTSLVQSADGGFLMSYVKVWSDTFMFLEKADKNMHTTWNIKIPLKEQPQYYSKIIETKDGSLIVPVTDTMQQWSFNIYSKAGKLQRSISTGIPDDRMVSVAQLLDDSRLICVTTPLISHGPSVVQVFSIKE
jgi:hypothetical protein